MKSTKHILLALMTAMMPALSVAQGFNEMEPGGTVTQRGNRNSGNFNPHSTDTTSTAEVPKGIYAWTVDPRFGDTTRVIVDTVPHLYPQSTLATGRFGQYNTTGSNYTTRLSRIFTDRPSASQFLFTDGYDQILREPHDWHFTNTLSPITNLSYDNCGDKTNGEDHIQARFAVNAGKRTGLGFDLNYCYARGYYQEQNNSHFGATFYISHLGDRYQMHALVQTNHQKQAENGGIASDTYITDPEFYSESYSDNEIPTRLSSNWNRNHSVRLFLNHRYAVGFYRKVPMTEEEKKARQFALDAEKDKAAREKAGKEEPAPTGRPDDAKVIDEALPEQPADSLIIGAPGRISVDSKEMADSLKAVVEEIAEEDQDMKQEFVPVTSFIHTLDLSSRKRTYLAYNSPKGLYADTFYVARPEGGYVNDSIYDNTRFLSVRNTFAIALLEGFNKYAAAGLKAFVTHDLRRFDMPDLNEDTTAYYRRWTEHTVSLGGQLVKAQGRLLHYNATVETWLVGEDAGQLKIDAQADLNFRLLGDTMRLEARGWMHRLNPVFVQRRYHSKHLWWDNDFDKETRTHVEGIVTCEKTDTRLRVALDNISNYTYLGMSYQKNGEAMMELTAAYKQHDKAVSVFTAQLDQRLALGPLHWDNIVTYQTTSESDVLPLPELNLFTNLYLKFKVASVLTIELGASGTWFTKYNSPDFLPQLNQYAVQQNKEMRMEVGNFPFVDVYANMHLKHARFFVMMNNVFGNSFDRNTFLTPHYPLNRSVLHMGVSWNFFN